jgi:hypothetical protein
MDQSTNLSYKERINQMEDMIYIYQKFGFFHFKILGGKEVIIKEFKLSDLKQKVYFLFESKFKERFEYDVSYNNLEKFLKENFLTCKDKTINISKIETDLKYNFNQIQIGYTSDYNLFKCPKKSINNTPDSLIERSFQLFGNIEPILVYKKQDKFLILKGKKRFKILVNLEQPIFYLDITSLITQEINEKFVSDTNLYFNNAPLPKIWDDLCKYYYPKYRELNEFILKNKIEKYINKYHFIYLLEHNKYKLLYGEATFDKKEELFKEILDIYKKIQNNEENNLLFKKDSKGRYILYPKLKAKYYKYSEINPFHKKENWYDSLLNEQNHISILDEIIDLNLDLNNLYSFQFFKRNFKPFTYEKEIIRDEKELYLIKKIKIKINVDSINKFLEENGDLIQEILKTNLPIDLDYLMKELIKEREQLFSLKKELN